MDRFVILEDGAIFKGHSMGASSTTMGEIVANHSMIGYQEIITDPTYTGQIIVFTYPEIGNIGIKNGNYESLLPSCKGIILGNIFDDNRLYFQLSLNDYLNHQGIPCVCDIDTRALAKHLNNGSMKASIVDSVDEHAIDQLNALVLPKKQIYRVATTRPYLNPGNGNNIVLIDLGLKNRLLRVLNELKINVTILPPTITIDDIKELSPQGIIMSSGPGNPYELLNLVSLIKEIQLHYPFFGIGLGFELFSLANNIDLEQCSQGHHGINYPVKEIKTGCSYITTQNFCYKIKSNSLNNNSMLRISYIDLLDHIVVGLEHKLYPSMAVQFEPESGPGPNDTKYIFNLFLSLINKNDVGD